MPPTPELPLPHLPTLGDVLLDVADALDAPFPAGERDRLSHLARLDVDPITAHRDEERALESLVQAVPAPYRDWWGRFLRDEISAYRSFTWSVPAEWDAPLALTRWAQIRQGAWQRSAEELTALTTFGGARGRTDVASELRWILGACGYSLAELELAVEPTLKRDKQPGSLERKWRTWLGGGLPTRASLDELAKAGLRTSSGGEIPSELLSMRLLAARAFQFLIVIAERDVPPPTPPGAWSAALRLLELSDPEAQAKSEQTAEVLSRALAEFEGAGYGQSRLCFVAPLVRGRLLVQTHCASEAVAHYEEAAERGAFRAGALLASILREALAVASHAKDLVAFRRLYGLAYYFGQLNATYEDLELEDRLGPVLARWSGKLPVVFPHPFPRTETTSSVQARLALEGALVDPEPWYRLGRDGTRKEVLVTRRNANSFFSGFGQRPLTPLMIAGERGDADEVDRLLRLGGDPNLRASDGSTALLRTLETVVQESRHARSRAVRAAFRLLAKDLSPSIDARTHERRSTALWRAVQAGHPDLVRPVIAQGAGVNGTAGVEGATPLVWALNYAVFSRMPRRTYVELLRTEGSMREPSLESTLAVPGSGLLFTREVQEHRVRNARSPEFEQLASAEHTRMVEHRDHYLEVVMCLLSNGGDPNSAPLGRPNPLTLAVRAHDLDRRSGASASPVNDVVRALVAGGGELDEDGRQLAASTRDPDLLDALGPEAP